MPEPLLNVLISGLAMIRVTIEAVEASEPTDSANTAFDELRSLQRGLLEDQWRALQARPATDFGMALATFKETVQEMMLTGLTEYSLSFLKNRAPVGDVCSVGERYFVGFIGGFDVLDAQMLPPAALFDRFVEDVRLEIVNDANYLRRSQFDQRVFRKMIALLYAIDAAGGRIDRWDTGGEASGAFVPREPVAPRLAAEAERDRPERTPEPADALAAGCR